jgi:defect-in-organelle-trafficking protein DotB
MDTENFFPHEPLGLWLPEQLDDLLLWAIGNNASDINLISNKPAYIRVHGMWVRASRRDLTSDELFMLLDEISRNPGSSARVRGGHSVDPSHEVKDDSGFRHRFRVNASAIKDGWSLGINLVLRSIPSTPPSLADLNVEPELVKHLFPPSGLVLITGVMGTGKSTLLASAMRHIIETGGRSLLTYEAPIEFDLSNIKDARGPVAQSELPVHLADSFSGAARNSARRAADVILIGESRDRETMQSMIEVSEIGVAAYSTVHTRSVHDTPSRILNIFERADQPSIATTMFSGLRLIVQQRLLPKIGGGRVAVKEYLAFDDNDRQKLINTPVSDITSLLKEMCIKRETDLLSATKLLHTQNLITDETLDTILQERS